MSRRVTKTVGRGLTRHKRTNIVFDGPGEPGDAEALAQAFGAAVERNAPWAWLEREKGIAERTLTAIEAGERGDDGDRIFDPHHGAGWYSREILERVGWIERALDRGDVESACRNSAEIGHLTATIRLKRAWDHDVDKWLQTEQAQRESMTQIASSRRIAPQDERVAAVDDWCARTGNQSVAAACKWLEVNRPELGKRDAIRADYNRSKKGKLGQGN